MANEPGSLQRPRKEEGGRDGGEGGGRDRQGRRWAEEALVWGGTDFSAALGTLVPGTHTHAGQEGSPPVSVPGPCRQAQCSLASEPKPWHCGVGWREGAVCDLGLGNKLDLGSSPRSSAYCVCDPERAPKLSVPCGLTCDERRSPTKQSEDSVSESQWGST